MRTRQVSKNFALQLARQIGAGRGAGYKKTREPKLRRHRAFTLSFVARQATGGLSHNLCRFMAPVKSEFTDKFG